MYPSFADALADIPAYAPANPKEQLNEDRLDALNACDYPVLFWLLRLLPETHFVFDLGGSIGMGYFSFRRYLPFPDDFRWVICDLPEIVEAGREIARKRNDHTVSFTTERQVERIPEVYYSSGTLQYIEEPIADILAALRRLPPHVIVNRTPMVERQPYITLQHGGELFVPYKVEKRARFVERMEALGYETVDAWVTDRAVSFLLDPQYERPLFHGMYFRLKSG